MVPSNLGYSLREAGSHFRRNWTSSLGAVFTIFLSLFIIGLFVLGSGILNSIIGDVENDVVIRAFIDDNASDEDIQAFQDEISGWDNVANVSFTTKEEALEEYSSSMSNASAEAALDALDNDNPLPRSFVIEMNDPEQVASTAERIIADENYVKIADNGDAASNVLYGQGTVDRLFTVTNYIRIGALVLVALLTFIAFIFINNTIRLSITARRREIAIMRLVGASNGFIRGPFVTEGVLQALLGALLSIGTLELIRHNFIPAISNSMSFMSFDLPIQVYLMTYAGLALIGVLIGLFGSAIAMRRYLKV